MAGIAAPDVSDGCKADRDFARNPDPHLRREAVRRGDNDLLELIDVVTGKTVLVVGTENTDDYYPSYVANFTPENMACNAGRG